MLSGNPSYDLRTEPWIPVRWAAEVGGERPDVVGLEELLARSHEIGAISVALPPALSALYRVLYALTARISGLDEDQDGEWSERRLDLLDDGQLDPEEVSAYFDRLPGRFELYGSQPFLQDPRLADQCDKTAGVNKLVVTRPAGNNHAWFRHGSDADPDLPDSAAAALHLLVWHAYGPSGRCSSRTVGSLKKADSSAGPLRGTLSFHPEGATLFHTLLAGLPVPGHAVRRENDLCPWERGEFPNPVKAPPVPSGPCSGLTARSQHALLLVPDDTGARVRDAYITWAYRDKVPRADDYLIWQTSKQGNQYPRGADSGRALWRDLDALLLKKPGGSAQPSRPSVFASAQEVADRLLELTGREEIRVRALGFEQDGQAKDTQFVDAATPPVLDLLEDRNPEVAPKIGELRRTGEMYGFRLDLALRRAWLAYTNGDPKKFKGCGWTESAAALYWPAAETQFWQCLETREFDSARQIFRRLAERIFNEITENAARTQRGAKACEEARIELYGGARQTSARTSGSRRQQDADGGERMTETAAVADQTPQAPGKRPSESLKRAREFVQQIDRLCGSDPGARAVLRRGLGKELDDDRVKPMHRLLTVRLGDNELGNEDAQRTFYAIASMIAEQSRDSFAKTRQPANDSAYGTSLGKAYAAAVAMGTDRGLRESSAESALNLLTKQSTEGLHRRLPAAVRQLRDRQVPVDWAQLLLDLRYWRTDSGRTSRRWLQDFYQARRKAKLDEARAADETTEPGDGTGS